MVTLRFSLITTDFLYEFSSLPDGSDSERSLRIFVMHNVSSVRRSATTLIITKFMTTLGLPWQGANFHGVLGDILNSL